MPRKKEVAIWGGVSGGVGGLREVGIGRGLRTDDDHEGTELVATHSGGVSRLVSEVESEDVDEGGGARE